MGSLNSVSGAAYKRSLDSLKNMLFEACNAYAKEPAATILEAEGDRRPFVRNCRYSVCVPDKFIGPTK